jgi:predicted HNH restriction endonuclease
MLRLDIELLPESSWNKNVRNMMGRDEWDKLRKKVYKLYKNKCGICGFKSLRLVEPMTRRGKLHCHEIWEFDDEKHTQTLTGFIALCELCHAIKHIGFAKIRADRGELSWDKLVGHYCKVNKCSRKDFKKDHKKAIELFKKRSRYDWEVRLSEVSLSKL